VTVEAMVMEALVVEAMMVEALIMMAAIPMEGGRRMVIMTTTPTMAPTTIPEIMTKATATTRATMTIMTIMSTTVTAVKRTTRRMGKTKIRSPPRGPPSKLITHVPMHES
jgi:hypothetical protein